MDYAKHIEPLESASQAEEREHCRASFEAGLKPLSGVQDGHIGYLMRERAAARAEGDAAATARWLSAEHTEVERLRSEWRKAAAELAFAACEIERLRGDISGKSAFVANAVTACDFAGTERAALEAKLTNLRTAAERVRRGLDAADGPEFGAAIEASR